jgi:hypothetical protein
MFNKVKKGSQTYRNILLKTVEPSQHRKIKSRKTGESARKLGENTFFKKHSLSGGTPAYHLK